VAKHRTKGETDWYHGILKSVREFFETMPVGAIQPADMDRYLAYRRNIRRKSDGERKLSESSLRKEIIATATCFKWAKRNRYVSSNPADREKFAASVGRSLTWIGTNAGSWRGGSPCNVTREGT